ncbi:hypothetical protein BJX70DRAFT_275881 [Aspergillus crustosus]
MFKQLTKLTRSTATPTTAPITTTLRHHQARLPIPQPLRQFTNTPLTFSSPQDEEDRYHDRNKLDPSRTENSQSATTDEVAQHDTAFDPSTTAPESEIGESKKESKSKGQKRDPLTVSAADQDVSGARDPNEGAPARNKEKGEGQHSGGGSPRKNRERK